MPRSAVDLQVPVLGNGLDHQVAGGEVVVVTVTASREDHLVQVAVHGAALDAAWRRRTRPAPGRPRRGRLVALDDDDVGSVDQEGVGDAGAHAAAAEDTDCCRKVAGSTELPMSISASRSLWRTFSLISWLISCPGTVCMRSNLAWDSKSIPWARLSMRGWASAGAWNTDLVIRTASGSCGRSGRRGRGPRPSARPVHGFR